jgi:hypothetical protein
MKFWKTMSVTKLVFLEVMTVLCFLVIWVVIAQNVENELGKTILQMFEFAVTSIISFYFGQKVGEAKADPLIDE